MGKITPKKRRLKLQRKRRVRRHVKNNLKDLSAKNAAIRKISNGLAEKMNSICERNTPPNPEEVIEINKRIDLFEGLLQEVQLKAFRLGQRHLSEKQAIEIMHTKKNAIQKVISGRGALKYKFKREYIKKTWTVNQSKTVFKRNILMRSFFQF